MEQKPETLRWPMGGVFKRLSHQDKPLQFAADAINVRPDGTIQGRQRGGSRPGLGKAYSTQLGAGNPIKLITDVVYDSSGTRVTRLLASANGSLYRDVSGAMTGVTSGVTLASDELQAASTLQKVYITGDNTANRAICVYDPDANTLTTASATAGTLPTGCKLCCVSADRLWVGGNEEKGVWYASRAGDPLDFDYSQDDATAAVSAPNSRAGSLSGEDMTAMITHTDDCVIMGSVSAIWSMRGNPKTSGSLVRLSDRVGVHGANSWSHDAEGWLWLWTQDGLYVMSPGCGNTPMSVSRELLPEELLNLDRSSYAVSLEYDFRYRGLHLFATETTTGGTTHYWIDTKAWETGDGKRGASASFWPMSYQADHEPFCAYSYRESTSSKSLVMLGCRDGYIRRYDSSLKQDDSSDITSYVYLGPFQPGELSLFDGILSQLVGELATNSGDVTWGIYPGDNAEKALAASAKKTGNWSAGVNPTAHPRVRGSSFFVKLWPTSSNTAWAMERVTAVVQKRGRRRV